MNTRFNVQEGSPYPRGATLTEKGTNFALFSANADKVEVCLFDEKGEKEITVLFNADTDPNLPWEFRTLQRKVKVTTGVDTLIYFEATNTSDEPTTGVAVYNVTPNKVGQYFDKIQCFCFDNQTLQPGEKMEMPVSFFIDPALEQDLDVKEVRTITLSYTFFKAKETK